MPSPKKSRTRQGRYEIFKPHVLAWWHIIDLHKMEVVKYCSFFSQVVDFLTVNDPASLPLPPELEYQEYNETGKAERYQLLRPFEKPWMVYDCVAGMVEYEEFSSIVDAVNFCNSYNSKEESNGMVLLYWTEQKARQGVYNAEVGLGRGRCSDGSREESERSNS